ncbi:MAG: MFS transporter [Patescibacteria group bacterium]
MKKKSYLKWFLFFSFVLALSNALIAYIQSSYLSRFMPEGIVGLMFIIAYVLSFLAINYFTSLINRLKIFLTGILIFASLSLSLLIYVFAQNLISVLFAFFLYVVFLNLLWIMLDIYLEFFSKDAVTGRIRGIYWTMANMAWFVSPLITGFILIRFDYSFLFLLGLLLVLFILICFVFKFSGLEVNHFPKAHFFKTVKKVWQDKKLKGIFIICFILQFFYSVMIIYTPLYLYAHAGLSWMQIGVIFTAMLSTFVFMTYPAGYLADKKFGEKEILILGLMVMGVSTLAMAFKFSSNFWFWMMILFMTRVGASLVDIMRDTYFFKHIDFRNVEIINLFRNTTPMAYIVAPLLASVILFFFNSYALIFALTGILVLSGIYFAFKLKDTL